MGKRSEQFNNNACRQQKKLLTITYMLLSKQIKRKFHYSFFYGNIHSKVKLNFINLPGLLTSFLGLLSVFVQIVVASVGPWYIPAHMIEEPQSFCIFL